MPSRSVILLDFDNIFGGLWELDREIARLFANDPDFWLTVLRDQHLVDDQRRWLVVRCYLNPAGFVYDDGERLYLSRFRPSLVRAGFEVVDCPAMTRAGKNAADIRLVIDALDLLASEAIYDEFVIASGDSDFAPLLQRLRSRDKRITVMTPSYTSAAYSSLADKLLDFDAIASLVKPQAVDPNGTIASPVAQGDGAVGDNPREVLAALIRSKYAEATAPLNLARLSEEVSRELPGARESNWFGAGGFKSAIFALDLPHAKLSQHYLWDEERHQPPATIEQADDFELPVPVQALVHALELPRLRQETWPKVFDVLARYAAEFDFNLTESSRWSRDTLAAEGEHVSRAALNHVIRGTQMGGTPLNRVPPPTALEISEAYFNNLIDRSGYFGVTLTSEDEDIIADWLGLPSNED